MPGRKQALFMAVAASVLVSPGSEAVPRGESRSQVDTVVIHAIGGPRCTSDGVAFTHAARDAAFWKSYFEGHAQYGIHWIVDRSGTTLASVPENQIAIHAYGANRSSIGIELVNDGSGLDPFPRAQIDALSRLICDIRRRWPSIPLAGIKGHGELDQRRLACGFKQKVDPGPAFPWSAVLVKVLECSAPPSAPAPRN